MPVTLEQIGQAAIDRRAAQLARFGARGDAVNEQHRFYVADDRLSDLIDLYREQAEAGRFVEPRV